LDARQIAEAKEVIEESRRIMARADRRRVSH
jgi:hypothetical protein